MRTLKKIADESKDSEGNAFSCNEIYNFTKGIVRNPRIEEIFIALGVPKVVIEKTFS